MAVLCPVCGETIAPHLINSHLDSCLHLPPDDVDDDINADNLSTPPPAATSPSECLTPQTKRPRTVSPGPGAWTSSPRSRSAAGDPADNGGGSVTPVAPFPLFSQKTTRCQELLGYGGGGGGAGRGGQAAVLSPARGSMKSARASALRPSSASAAALAAITSSSSSAAASGTASRNKTPASPLAASKSSLPSVSSSSAAKQPDVNPSGYLFPSLSPSSAAPSSSSAALSIDASSSAAAASNSNPLRPSFQPTTTKQPAPPPVPPSSPFAMTGKPTVAGKSPRPDCRPLADRMRPETLEDLVGQSEVIGENTLMRTLLEANEIPSIILWGPPGCGKTSLAHVIAASSRRSGRVRFVTLSATSASTADVREAIRQAQNDTRLAQRRTILFIDEIHRFNKSQQDTFLPHVESGVITLMGATTENPSFQVNAALLSRCRVLVLRKLEPDDLRRILLRALPRLGAAIQAEGRQQGERLADLGSPGLPNGAEPTVLVEEKALDTISWLVDGDARAALNGLQMAVQAVLAARDAGGPVPTVTEAHVKEGLQRSHLLYDRAGEEHYNCVSALHKSLRGSDASAGLYWLARMLEGGEDPLYVARRLVRFASEDVGLADPLALPQAVAAYQSCHFIGMPECEVILAQCATYLALAPKSVEVYAAYKRAKASVRSHRGPLPPVPLHLRNAPTGLMRGLGYGRGYKYNPDFDAPVEQDYLPEELRGVDFFKPAA